MSDYSGFYLDKIYDNFTSLSGFLTTTSASAAVDSNASATTIYSRADLETVYSESANSYWTVHTALCVDFQ